MILERRRRQSLVSAVVAIGLLTGGLNGLAHAATDEERAAARNLADKAMEAFNAQRYTEAIDLFQRAETLVHSPIHLLFLGRAYVASGQLVRAQEAFLKASREDLGTNAPASRVRAVQDATKELDSVRPRLAELTIRVTGGSDSKVTVDETEIPKVLVGVPMPVDPGQHRVEVRAEGYLAAWRKITLAEGQSQTVELELVADAAAPAAGSEAPAANAGGETQPVTQAAATSTSSPTWMLVGSIAGYAVGAGGLVWGTLEALRGNEARNRSDELYNSCYTSCKGETDAAWREANSHYRRSIVPFIIGGVGVAAGTVLIIMYALDGEEPAPPATGLQVRPWVGINSAGLAGSF